MEAFFSLPYELQTLVLTNLENADLDRLFELPKLLHEGAFCSPYLTLQHQALWAKYHRQNLVFLNSAEFRKFTLRELEYLIKNGIVISPAEITVVLFDFTDYSNSVSFMYTMFNQYFGHLRKFTDRFSVQLLLVENVPLENSFLKLLFEPLRLSEFSVNWFTIKYHPGLGKRSREGGALQFSPDDLLQVGSEIAITNLQLHLFSSSNLLKHLVDDHGCFYCRNLESLDLSYNGITELVLGNLHLPASLRHLNLSNNLLNTVSNRTFLYGHLHQLRSLNLSNNNIMSFELRDTEDNGEPYVLELVNLSGNLLADCNTLFQSRLFEQVKQIDLSNNLLENVAPFPPLAVSIDISGNYLHLHGHQMAEVLPRGLRRFCVSAAMPNDNCYAEFAKILIQEAGLWSLSELLICGVHREIPREVM